MKDYELTVLIHPDMEMNLDPALDKVKKTIEANHGEIVTEENDGKKRLSYPIDGQQFAVYYYYDVRLPAEAPSRISSTLNITDEILRYLLVRADARKAKYAALHTEQDTNESAGEEPNESIVTTSEEKGE